MKEFKQRKAPVSIKKSLLKVVSLALVISLVVGLLGGCKKSDVKNANSSTSSLSKTTTSSKPSTTSSSKATGTAATKTGDTNQQSGTGSEKNASSDVESSGDRQTSQQSAEDISPASGEQPSGNITEELKMDLGGKTIVYSVWNNWRNICSYDFMADARNNIVVKTFLNRMAEAEKKYNFKLDIREEDPYKQRDDFITNSLAGVFYADVVATQSRFAFPKFIKGNMIYPVDEYYDFNSDPVWNGNSYFRTGCFWNGRYYGITGAVTGYGSGVVFNRDNMEKEGYPDLQDMVASGQWTWDSMLDMAQKFTRDLNGDGIVDTYGILAGSVANGIVYSNGGRFLDFRPDGSIKFGLTDTRSIKALQFVADLYNVYKVVKNKAPGGAGLVDFGNVLFYFGDIGQVTFLKDMGFRAGFAPYPKGPDVTDYQNVTTASNILVFSNQTEFKKEVVRIFADVIATWDPSKPDCVSPYEVTSAGFKDRFMDQRDLDCVVKYAQMVQFDLQRGFDGFESDVNRNLFGPITSGTMPVGSAIEAYRNAAQSLIDSQR